MRIKSIELQNFLPFKHIKLDLLKSAEDPASIYFISGINYNSNDDDSSNGSGKSSIIGESIMYNIYGKGLRGSKQKVKLNDMIKMGTSKMVNKVEYFTSKDDSNDIMQIIRSKVFDGISSVELIVDGKDKSKRSKRLSDKDIKNYINLLPEVFTQIICYYTDNINLLAMNYGQRLDFFKNLIDLSIIDDYFNKVKSFHLKNEESLKRLNIQKESTKDIIRAIQENVDKYSEYILTKVEECKKEYEEALLIELEDENVYDININELKLKIEECNKNIQTFQVQRNTTKTEIDKISVLVNKIKKLTDLSCPTCQQTVPKQHTDTIIASYRKEYEELTQKIEKYNIQLKKIEENKSQYVSDFADLTTKKNKIQSTNLLHKQKIKNLERNFNKAKQELEEITTNSNDTVDISKYQSRLSNIEKAITIRESWKENISYWVDMFAPKSQLRSSILSNYISVLSDIFEYYVIKLYNNEIIGKIIIDEEGQIDIILIKEGYDLNYWQMSSGERKRIDIAMQLASYEFLSYINHNIPKFIILDEIFDSVDYPGICNIVDTLIEFHSKFELDLFIISHINIPLERIPESLSIKHIVVEKKGQSSSVKLIERVEDNE